MKPIGTQLKELRKREALTVRYVSEKLHLRMGFLSDIEHNRKKPAEDLVKRMCRLYGYDQNLLHPRSELSAFQEDVGEWGDKTFNAKRKTPDPIFLEGRIAHFMKEAAELNASYENEEVADCFMLLLHIAHLKGFDLLEEARKKMEINRKRTWGEADELGMIEHV